MRFWLLGLAVALASQLVAATAASLLVAAVCRSVLPRLAAQAPAGRARLLLALALFPAAAGLAVAGLVGLAWLVYEPRSTTEFPGPVLLVLSALGLAVSVGRAGWLAHDALETARLVAGFRRAGRELGGLPLPASRAAHAYPVAALAGVVRPRLLLADHVLRALGPDELDALVAHELAHLAARDNLKRLLLAASPDPLAFTPIGRRLRSEFLGASEAAADAHACIRVPSLTLARAILKVAALVPAGARLDLAMAGFHHEASLAARVQALVDVDPARVEARGPHGALALPVAVALGLAGASVVAGSALGTLYGVVERLVHLLG